tara:strand:+ start:117584 stop:117862 length:279 start_codon:yes stop_codon:yes gene_type:complete
MSAIDPSITKHMTPATNSSQKMEQAAVKFEQFFIKNMLDNAQNSMPGDGLLGDNEQRRLMQGLHNQAISEQLATSKSFGIADLLIQQAKLNK